MQHAWWPAGYTMSQFPNGPSNQRPRPYPYSHYTRQAVNQYRQASDAPPLGPTTVSQDLAQAYAVLWLRPGAPAMVVKAAYRALAAHYHPDVGGDSRVMARLNLAYDLIKRHLQ
jgi:hypothetical protein